MALGCFFLDNGKPRIFRLARMPNGLLNTRKMEVKIKNNEEMIDATIEIINGVMVVSPVNANFKPKEGEVYYRPTLSFAKFEADLDTWLNSDVDDDYYKKGWVFKEKTDCEDFCLKLNEAINQVKP